MAVDTFGYPVRIIVTSGTVHDVTQAERLIEGIRAEYLFGDKGYDSDALVNKALSSGMRVVIPPKRNRKEPRYYDKDLYKLRHLAENAFLHLKKRRGIATRYAKNTESFVAAVQIRCIDLWTKFLF